MRATILKTRTSFWPVFELIVLSLVHCRSKYADVSPVSPLRCRRCICQGIRIRELLALRK